MGRRGLVGVAAALILLLALEPAAAAFRWPWQHQHRRASHYRHSAPVQTPVVDCAAIRAAISKMSPDALARSLRSLDRERRDVVDRCAKES